MLVIPLLLLGLSSTEVATPMSISNLSRRSTTYWITEASVTVVSPSHPSRNRSRGPRTLRPYSSSKGEKPVDSCGTSRYANSKCCR
ncbi:hypothetical protein FKM82_029324 [Ascaphus truei]